MFFNKNELKYLKEFEDSFHSAIYADYIRNFSSKKLDSIINLYQIKIGKEINICRHCSSSIFQFIKKIGTIYFNDLNELNELNDSEIKDEENENKDNNAESIEIKKTKITKSKNK